LRNLEWPLSGPNKDRNAIALRCSIEQLRRVEY
jgi:hypothetical protein